MTWTYSPGGATAKDRIRDRIGDVDQAPRQPTLQNETIEAVLDAEGDNERAAALACLRLLLPLYARQADTGVKSADLYTNQRFERLRHIEETLLQEMAIAGGGASAPGLSKAARDAMLADADRPAAAFSVGMLDFKC